MHAMQGEQSDFPSLVAAGDMRPHLLGMPAQQMQGHMQGQMQQMQGRTAHSLFLESW